MANPFISDHWLRVLTIFVNLSILGTIVFYAGGNTEKLNNLSKANAGPRITALETRVETLVTAQEQTNTAIWQLVMKLNKEQ